MKMNYLQNKKGKKNYSAFIFFSAILFILILLSPWIKNGLIPLAVPFWRLSVTLEDSFLNIFSFLRSQKKLVTENEELRKALNDAQNELLIKKSLLRENIELKIMLGREENPSKTFLAAVLARPVKLFYDDLLIEVGKKEGVSLGDVVLGNGEIVLGRLEEVYDKVSKVRLLSSHQAETDVQIGDEGLVATLKGRGAGNFYLELPRELEIAEGDQALLPGSKIRVLAIVRKVEKEEGSSVQKVYLKSPINIFNLKWVRVLPSTSL